MAPYRCETTVGVIPFNGSMQSMLTKRSTEATVVLAVEMTGCDSSLKPVHGQLNHLLNGTIDVISSRYVISQGRMQEARLKNVSSVFLNNVNNWIFMNRAAASYDIMFNWLFVFKPPELWLLVVGSLIMFNLANSLSNTGLQSIIRLKQTFAHAIIALTSLCKIVIVAYISAVILEKRVLKPTAPFYTHEGCANAILSGKFHWIDTSKNYFHKQLQRLSLANDRVELNHGSVALANALVKHPITYLDNTFDLINNDNSGTYFTIRSLRSNLKSIETRKKIIARRLKDAYIKRVGIYYSRSNKKIALHIASAVLRISETQIVRHSTKSQHGNDLRTTGMLFQLPNLLL